MLKHNTLTMAQKINDDVISKEEYIEKLNTRKKNRSDEIINRIWQVVDINKNRYNVYIKLITIRHNELYDIFTVIRKELFSTDMLFNIKVNRYLGVGTIIYIKFYHAETYTNAIKTKFNKLLACAFKNNKSIIYIKKMIATKNKLMAECYARNYNSILGPAGYKFCTHTYENGFKYCVYVHL